MTAEQDKSLGAVLGSFIGDALGSYLEFNTGVQSEEDIEKCMEMAGNGSWGLAPGQVTDDSELAMAQMRALVEAQGELDPAVHCKYYGTWYQHNPVFVGPSTANALSTIDPEKPDPKVPYAAALEMNA